MEEALKAFGEEGFDVKAWVNAQVRASEALAESAGHAKGANVDDNLSTLVVKLQLMAQSASKAVDEHAQKLIMELPHAMVDIERVGADSSLLAAQMAQVLDKVSEVERTGQQTVSALATLDAVKTRMEECAQMLAEAESVSRILTQLEPLFQKDELREIAARLGSLRRSLESMGQLEGFGDAAARLKTFEGIPPKYARMKRMVVPDALRVTHLRPGRRFCVLGRLSNDVGWRHWELIKSLEERRKVASKEYYEKKKAKAVLKAKAVEAADLTAVNTTLAQYGY